MERGEHHTVLASVEQCKRKALIAAGVVERAEPHQADMPDDSRQYMNDVVVLRLHASYGLSRGAHSAQILRQYASGVLVTYVPKYGIQACVHVTGVPLNSPCPKPDDKNRRQEREPENECVLVVREVKRVNVKLADLESIAALV